MNGPCSRRTLLARGNGRAEPAKFVQPFWLAAARSPSPCPLPEGEGIGILRLSLVGRRSYWHRALRNSTPRRPHDPLCSIRPCAAGDSPSPRGEGRGEGEGSARKTNALANCRWTQLGSRHDADGRGWLGETVELSLQNSSGRFGWRRLVPPHPGPPAGTGNWHLASFLLSGAFQAGRGAEKRIGLVAEAFVN